MALQTVTANSFSKRKLLLRDGLTFLILTLAAAALYAVTLFLFTSFESHREDLGKRWSSRGQQSMQQGRPAEAITALRAALTYAPDNRDYQLLLAQALADAGRTDEATAYYQAFWDARPGDGDINLQLARLARRKGDAREAVDFYRAAVFGSWQGDGIARRREVRIELADYLVDQHERAAARAELLLAAGDAPDQVDLDLLLGDKLQAASDSGDAMAFYQKAITAEPGSEVALERAGRLAYSAADYVTAHRLLLRAAPLSPGQGRQDLEGLAQRADRLDDLNLSSALPAAERYKHLLIASTLARKRLKCMVPTTPALTALQTSWKAADSAQARKALPTDPSTQDAMTGLIITTEVQTAQSCGSPEGDDALLLSLAGAEGHAN